MKKSTYSTLFLMLMSLFGCVTTPVTSHLESGSFLYVNRNHDLGMNLSKQVVFIADNQFHNIYCDPISLGSSIADTQVHVAIRPSQLNLFAPDLFTYALQENAQGSIIIHLGDALNVSSTYEWSVFYDSISNPSLGHDGWYMVPGNHDVYFMGNGAGKPDKFNERGGKLEWTDAANSTGLQTECCPIILDHPFTKDRFVKSYVEHLKSQDNSSVVYENSPKKESFHGVSFEWSAPMNSGSVLHQYFGKYYDDDETYWKSFIVQELTLDTRRNGPLTLILVDTTNYLKRPSFIGALWSRVRDPDKVNSGENGAISKEQYDLIIQKVFDNPTHPISQFMIVGHHPYNTLTKDSKKWLEKLSGRQGFIAYVSGHTHDPIKAYKSCEKKLDFPEFNIGSVTDTPTKSPKNCPRLFKPSPQYAILTKNGELKTQDTLACSIMEAAKAEGFPFRGNKYYMQYREKKPFLKFYDTKKNPHRKNLKLLSLGLYDMFMTLYPDNPKLTKILHELYIITCDDYISKGQVAACVQTLKEAQILDEESRIGNERKRLLYGAWEALQASLAEAGYTTDHMDCHKQP